MPSTKECLTQFATDRTGDYNVMAEFCGVQPFTVITWFETGQMPKGGVLLNLRHFLRLAGYTVDELEELSPLAVQAGELIAFRLVTPEQMRDNLEFVHTTGVFDVVLRGKGVMPTRNYRLEQLVKSYAMQLEQKRNEFKAVFSMSGSASSVRDGTHLSEAPTSAHGDVLVTLTLDVLRHLELLLQATDLAGSVDQLKAAIADNLSGDQRFDLALRVNDMLGV